MNNSVITLPIERLKRAVDIREQIDSLTVELHQVLAGLPSFRGNGNGNLNGRKRVLSPTGRARIAAAQRLRWAKFNAERGERPQKPDARHHLLSSEGRARVSAAVKARWVQYRLAKAKAALARQ